MHPIAPEQTATLEGRTRRVQSEGWPQTGPSSDIDSGVVVVGRIHDARVHGNASTWIWWWYGSNNADDNERLILKMLMLCRRSQTTPLAVSTPFLSDLSTSWYVGCGPEAS